MKRPRKSPPRGTPQRKVFLRNAVTMRKRGTARGRQAMIVTKAAEQLLPMYQSPIDRYRQYSADECSRALSGSIRPRQYFTRREIMTAHRLVESMTAIMEE